VIQKHIQDTLAEMLLGGEVSDGDTIKVSSGPDGLRIGDRVSVARRNPPPSEAVLH